MRKTVKKYAPTVRKKQWVEADVLELARARIAQSYRLFDHVAVSFSAGKDSTVVLNLALEYARQIGRLPLDVIFWDEEAITPETVEYADRVRRLPDVALRWYAIPVKHRNGCSRRSPWWRPFDPACPELWCRKPPSWALRELPGFRGEAIPKCNRFLFPREVGTAAMLMGIRADESLNRYRSVTNKVEDNWWCWDEGEASHVAKCKPIYDWTAGDVWLAPHLMGWDYNRSYDIMARMGLTPNQQRVAPPYGEEPMQRLYTYQLGWPELWATMCRRVPGAATAARYARTELYNFGKVEKPEGASWKEMIAVYLLRWNPQERIEIAKNIKWCIAYHARKSDDPIPDEAEHPDSGVSWRYIAMIASRGDLKGRRKPTLDPNKGKGATAKTARLTRENAAQEAAPQETATV